MKNQISTPVTHKLQYVLESCQRYAHQHRNSRGATEYDNYFKAYYTAFNNTELCKTASLFYLEWRALHLYDIYNMTPTHYLMTDFGHCFGRHTLALMRLLTQSYWDIYYVLKISSQRIYLRRIYDDSMHTAQLSKSFRTPKRNTYVALRLFGNSTRQRVAMPTPICLPTRPLVIEDLRKRFDSDNDAKITSWKDFMNRVGSTMIFEYALKRFYRIEKGGAPSLLFDEAISHHKIMRQINELFRHITTENKFHDTRRTRHIRPIAHAPAIVQFDWFYNQLSLLIFDTDDALMAYQHYEKGKTTSAILSAINFLRIQPNIDVESGDRDQNLVHITRISPNWVYEDPTPTDLARTLAICTAIIERDDDELNSHQTPDAA